jgi:hypothetical protein
LAVEVITCQDGCFDSAVMPVTPASSNVLNALVLLNPTELCGDGLVAQREQHAGRH